MTEKNSKIKVIKACYVGGQVRKPGEMLTVSVEIARELAWMKKAELVKPDPQPAPAVKASESAPAPAVKAPEAPREADGKSEEKKGGKDK